MIISYFCIIIKSNINPQSLGCGFLNKQLLITDLRNLVTIAKVLKRGNYLWIIDYCKNLEIR